MLFTPLTASKLRIEVDGVKAPGARVRWPRQLSRDEGNIISRGQS